MEQLESKWYNRRLAGVRLGEICLYVGIYFLFAVLYYVTLFINRKGFENPDDHLISFTSFMDDGGLQYLVMMLLSVMVWLLVFRVLHKRPLWQRLLTHLFTLPLWVYLQLMVYYLLSEWIGWWHLQGTGIIWDVYIPILFYILQFGLIHAYEHYVINLRKRSLEIELKNAALKSELNAIKAQLNPHFLYNVFNTINASVPPELETTREMIAGLSDLFRYQLRASQQDLVPLRDELDFIRGYLDLEKKRFEERLSVSIEAEESVLEAMVPPMILQPLVENSIKHGLSALIEGGEVHIRIKREGGKLKFTVADTGVGIPDKSSVLDKGIGLQNTQKRLLKRYNTGLKLTDNQPRGLVVQFAI